MLARNIHWIWTRHAGRGADSRRLRIDDKDDTLAPGCCCRQDLDLAGAPAGYQEQVGLISSRQGRQPTRRPESGGRVGGRTEWVKLGKPQRLGRTCWSFPEKGARFLNFKIISVHAGQITKCSICVVRASRSWNYPQEKVVGSEYGIPWCWNTEGWIGRRKFRFFDKSRTRRQRHT
jgi:hypothetical protein